MWIKIVPNDTLFFRTGRPFSIGSETWAEGIFPPYPSTMYGALRTFLLFQRGNLKNFRGNGYPDIGSFEQKGSMKITGPLLSKGEILFFSVPMDLVKEKNEDELVILSKINRPEIFISDYPSDQLLIFTDRGQLEDIDGFIDDSTLKDYLECKKQKFSCVTIKEFYSSELKIGIARERVTLTSKEGYLYRIPMIRLNKDTGISVKVSDVSNLPENGVFQLGGEGKTVYFIKLDGNPLEKLENIELKMINGIFKLYLATPAIFEKGWLPEWLDENTMEGVKDGVKLKLISCAIGKFIRVGGWDMAKEKPKPMKKAVPAGSVYYFKILNNKKAEDIKTAFHLKNISDINPEEGFGLSLVGDVS